MGTLDLPLPMGDPVLSGFTYSSFSTDWDGTILGLVESTNARSTGDAGRCLILLGTLTPTSIDDGTTTNPFSTPSVGMIVDGGVLDSDVNECDTGAVEAAGYGWILDAEVTVGTTFPFYAEFVIQGDQPPEPQAVYLGNPSSNDSLFYEPTVVHEIPVPDVAHGSTSTDDLLPVGSTSGFVYDGGLAEWEGYVLGLVETGAGRFNNETGTCLVLVGVITPTSIDEGVTTNPFSAPSFGIVSAGRLIDGEVNECDISAIESAGYAWILDAEVTVGTAYRFYEEFFFAGQDDPALEAIVVGVASSDDTLLYEPTVVAGVPTP